MNVAIDLVAQRCGVSKSTVSRVINQRPYVKEELRQRVLEAMRDLNYAPRQMAVQKVVALAVAGIGGRMGLYEAALVSSLTGHLMKRGLGVRIQPVENFDGNQAFDIRCVISTGPSIIPNLPKDGQLIVVNNVAKGAHSVHSDHAQGLALAVERLASLGHTRIAFIVGSGEGWGNLERLRGYRESVAKLGLAQESALVQSRDAGMVEAMAKTLLAKPTAIIVGGEDNALEANYALRILGRRVPEDISLVTFESPNASKFLAPPNSTIDQEIEGIAQSAAGLAAMIVDGETPEKPVEIVTENRFIERESTRKL